jgi:hypothetical protein
MNTAIAVFAAMVAFAGVVIAGAQFSIARTNLKHALFERRYAVYGAARQLLADVFRQANVSQEQIFAFVRATDDSVFVLDDQVTQYLDELRKKAFRLAFLREVVEAGNPSEDLNGAIKESTQIAIWFTDQLPILIGKFKPFLCLNGAWFNRIPF